MQVNINLPVIHHLTRLILQNQNNWLSGLGPEFKNSQIGKGDLIMEALLALTTDQ